MKRSRFYSFCVLLLFFPFLAVSCAQDGGDEEDPADTDPVDTPKATIELDTSFNPGTGADGDVWCMVVQSDDKILIGGKFTTYNGTARNRIARLNADGTLDTTFDPGTGADGEVLCIALQSDGRILIGGTFKKVNDKARPYFARLGSDGSYDGTFNDAAIDPSGYVRDIAVQSDGKMVVCGDYSEVNPINRNYILRVKTDGAIDDVYNKVSDGAGPSENVHRIILQSDGKALIYGLFHTYDGVARSRIARLNDDGRLDTTFDPGTGLTGTDSFLSATLQSDGKLLVGGIFTKYNGTVRNRIARINGDGSLDTTFDPGAGCDGDFMCAVFPTGGKIIIGGNFYTYNNTQIYDIARLNADGSLDASFNKGEIKIEGRVRNMALLSGNKILVSGQFTKINDVERNRVARLSIVE